MVAAVSGPGKGRLSRGGGMERSATAAVRQTEGTEDVEPDDGPAEGAQVVVDLVHEPSIAAAALGRPGTVTAATAVRPATVEHDVDRGITRERALDVLVELLPVALHDHDLLHALVGAAVLGAFCPALRERMELGQDLEGPLVEELGEQHPGISATRGA